MMLLTTPRTVHSLVSKPVPNEVFREIVGNDVGLLFPDFVLVVSQIHRHNIKDLRERTIYVLWASSTR